MNTIMDAKIELKVSTETSTLHVKVIRGSLPALLHGEIIAAAQEWLAFEAGMGGTRYDRFRVEQERGDEEKGGE